MFVTTAQVKTITNKTVNAGLVERAQYAIEAYVGKFEADVEDTRDLEILKRATAYQAAYMLNNEDIVFEQMAVSTTMQNEASTTFKAGDKTAPFIAPMAIMMCDKLSFMRARSVYTGKMLDTTEENNWRTV
jgi:hypothetical protein